MKKKPTGPTAIIDPPWDYNRTSSSKKLSGYSDEKYPPLPFEELAKLPIGFMANYIFLWTTGPFIEQGYALVRKWGFEPITFLPWIKINKMVKAKEPAWAARLKRLESP